MRHITDLRPCAVESLPSLGEGQTSTDQRPRRLLNKVKRLLLEVGQMPLFGIKHADFQARLHELVQADVAATAAVRRRQQLFSQFISWSATQRGIVLAANLDDIVSEFYDRD